MEAAVMIESHELTLTGRMKLMVGLPSAISYLSGSSLQEVRREGKKERRSK
jgi:hypothetical protein